MDSNASHAHSFVRAFKEFGKDAPFEELKCLIGMGAGDILEKYLSEAEIERFGEDLKEYRKKVYLSDYLPEVKTFPGLRELFEKIKSNELQIVLATSASEEELEKYHEKLKISDLLEDETNADDTDKAKPAPDIFEAAFQKLKSAEKKDVLVIGDTPYDAQAAVKAGLKIIGVESGGWSREKLIEEGCAEVYRNIGEILEKYTDIFGERSAAA